MRTITLKDGLEAIVDDQDFENLSKYKWHSAKGRYTHYARRAATVSEGRDRKTILMHREILGLKDGKHGVDHADHNGLNNQRSNLRIATPSQNCSNRKAWGKSKYKGVCHHISWGKKRWRATICIDKKCIHIGLFDSEIEAAMAYDKKAKEIYREYSKLNFPS